MSSVAVIGAKGYVGKALCEVLAHSPGYSLTSITRENYTEMQKHSFDVLINSAMPSVRFWAKKNPDQDFIETVKKTADLLYGWKFKKFVQISTISARCQLDTVYGRHKASAEKLCNFGDNLIIRLGPMYSSELKKGVLVDILEGKKVFVAGESRYCFAPLNFIAHWVVTHLDRQGIIKVGARDSISLQEIAKHLNSSVEFGGAVDHQEIESPEPDFPEARDVLDFLDSWER